MKMLVQLSIPLLLCMLMPIQGMKYKKNFKDVSKRANRYATGLFGWLWGTQEEEPITFSESDLSGRVQYFIARLKEELNPDISSENEQRILGVLSPENVIRCQKASTFSPECALLMHALSEGEIFDADGKTLSCIKNIETALLKKNPEVIPFTIQDVERLDQLDEYSPREPQEVLFDKALVNTALCINNITLTIQYAGLSPERKEIVMDELIDSNRRFKQTMKKLSNSRTDIALKKKMTAFTTRVDQEIEELKRTNL